MHSANVELAEFNSFAAEQHAHLAGRFATHVATLQVVHADLLRIFKRVRALRGRLIERHPGLAAALIYHEESWEASLERTRDQGTASSKVSAQMQGMHLGAQAWGVVPDSASSSTQEGHPSESCYPPVVRDS